MEDFEEGDKLRILPCDHGEKFLFKYESAYFLTKAKIWIYGDHTWSLVFFSQLINHVLVSGYHAKCIDPWLVKTKRICPQCRKRVFESNERGAGLISVSSEDAPGSDSDSDFAQPSRSVLKRVRFHSFTGVLVSAN